MKLSILTPDALVVDREVRHVRAEDASGAFGILPGHADLITTLIVSVLVYRDETGEEHFVAVRGGILTVSARSCVEVVTREAVVSDDLALLEHDVLDRLRGSATVDARAHRGFKQLETALLRRVAHHARVEAGGARGERPWRP